MLQIAPRNPVLPMVREVHNESDPYKIAEYLQTGKWVVINGVCIDGQLHVMLGRVA